MLVLTAAIGEGHVTAARALAARLDRHPAVTEVCLHEELDVLGPRLGRFLTRGFHTHLEQARFTYELSYQLFFVRRASRLAAQRLLGRLSSRGLRSAIGAWAPDVVVTEFPVLSAALGELRARGQISVPVCSSISDPAGLHYWVHPGVDMHLLSWPEALGEAEMIGGQGRAIAVRAMIDERFHDPPAREPARATLGLPAEGEVVAVSGGGWGMGEVAEIAHAILRARPDALVLALAGRNDALRERLEHCDDPRLRVLAFTDQMPQLMAACDVLVHTTGGTTALEARVVGCRLINFGRGVAHVRAHATAMAKRDLAEWARTLPELPAALERTLRHPRPAPLGADYPDPAEVVVAVARSGSRRGSERANQLAAPASASAAGPGS